MNAMKYIHYEFDAGPEDVIEVSLDRAANVQLLDDENYDNWPKPNTDTGGEFYPLLTRPVAARRIASSGSGTTASPPTTR
jgi:hypothetical protein